MFCPVCKAEYRPGFTRCSDCDVNLVESLSAQGPAGAEAEEVQDSAALDSPKLLWSGIDGGAFARITAALEEADVPFNDEKPDLRLIYASMRHPLQIWIQRRDREAARRVLEEVLGTCADDETSSALDEAASGPGDSAREPVKGQTPTGVILRPEESKDLSRNPSGQRWEEPAGAASDDLLEDFDPDEATVEVWSGDTEGMAQMLKDCLRENGIGCSVDGDPTDKQRLLARPENEARAREIVREVVEGVPPG